MFSGLTACPLVHDARIADAPAADVPERCKDACLLSATRIRCFPTVAVVTGELLPRQVSGVVWRDCEQDSKTTRQNLALRRIGNDKWVPRLKIICERNIKFRLVRSVRPSPRKGERRGRRTSRVKLSHERVTRVEFSCAME